MKKVFKYLLYTVLSIISFAALYALAFYTLPGISMNKNGLSSNDEVKIYLSNNGVHTDFIVPAKNNIKDWSLNFNGNDTQAKVSNAEYLKIGWGDSKIYFDTPTWDDLTASTALSAAFGMNESVVKVSFLNTVKENDRCVAVNISKEQYNKLVAYIENSLSDSTAVKNPVIAKVYGTNCAFYPAKGRLSMFKVCNSWVNKGLYEADLPSVFWTIKCEPIFELYKNQKS